MTRSTMPVRATCSITSDMLELLKTFGIIVMVFVAALVAIVATYLIVPMLIAAFLGLFGVMIAKELREKRKAK